MYCVNLQDNRVVVKCNVIYDERMKFLSAVYDTGARYTCFRANILNAALHESDFRDAESKFLTGFVGDEASKFYRCTVERFAFGNIDLGQQDVWITFDPRVTTNLVGYDVIRQLTRASIGASDRENFFASEEELKDFVMKL